MITKEQQKQGFEILNIIAEKCWESPDFKENLINNPKLELENLFGNQVNLPENKKIVIEDQTDNNIIYLNIPQKPDFSNIELSDEQLEAVAGGEIGITGWILIGGAVLLAGGAVGYGIGQAVK